MWYIYPLYVILLCFVVFLSIKLANLVDLLDKKTKISGAFIPVDNYCIEAPFLCYNLLGDL